MTQEPAPTRMGPPRPEEIRTMILGDHKELRTRLERLGKLLDTERIENHGDKMGEARKEFHALAQFFEAHTAFEDEFLAPLLRDDFAWGDERAKKMMEHHVEQREELAALDALVMGRQGPRTEIVGALERFVAALELDMQHEEKALLAPEVMGDNLVVVEAGA